MTLPLMIVTAANSVLFTGIVADDLFAIAMMFIGYVLSRTQYWRLGTLAVALSMWSAPLIAAFNLNGQFSGSELTIITWYFPAAAVIFLLFPFRVTVLSLLLGWLVTIAYYLAVPSLTLRIFLMLSTAYLGMLLLLSTLTFIQRNLAREREVVAAEVNEQRRLAEALMHTGTVLTSTLDLDKVLELILEQVATIIPSSSSDIMLIENGTARIVRARGYAERGTEREILQLRFKISDIYNFRYIYETGEPIWIPDTQRYPEWVKVEVSDWIRSQLSAPIRLDGEIIGFLNVSHAKPNAFAREQANHLAAFASQAAIAIRNARLYTDTRRYVGDLEAEVNERAAQINLMHGRLRAILDSTGEGIYYSEGMRIQYANAALANMIGYTQDELTGMTSEDLRDYGMSSAELQELRAISAMIWKHGVWRGESRMRRKDGSTFYAGLTIAPVGTRDQAALRSVTIVRDISRQKELDLQKANFVAHASHELRTPITNLKTRLYLLRRRPDALQEHLVVLEEVTERMKRLVEDLLDRTRLERGQIPLRFENMSLQRLVGRVVAVQQPEAENRGLEFTLDMPETPIIVRVDSARIIQVLTNLITNAINYTPSGGAVRLTVVQETARVGVCIEDTGVGIAPEHLPHIFEPFYRVASEVEGTGLGLSIARQIIQLHSGVIEVSSELGKGSRFSVYLIPVPEQVTPVMNP